jgi:hypothetical protein
MMYPVHSSHSIPFIPSSTASVQYRNCGINTLLRSVISANADTLPDVWKPQDLKGDNCIKPDGERIEWRVAFPQGSARGKVPFWCFDVTPREKRVTFDPNLTRHPSGAKGVGAILASLDEKDLVGVRTYLDVVLPKTSDGKDFTYGSVKHVDGFSQPRISIADIVLHEKTESTMKGRQFIDKLKIFCRQRC